MGAWFPRATCRRFARIADEIARFPSPTPEYEAINSDLESAYRLLAHGYADWEQGFRNGDQATAARGDQKLEEANRLLQEALDRPSRIASRLGENF